MKNSRVRLFRGLLMRKFVLIAGLLCWTSTVYASERISFAYSPEWLALVHYQKGWFGYEGTIGSDNFYLSPDGRTNPQKELEATIALFEGADNEKKCLFPARYMVLKKHGLVKTDFLACQEFEQFKDDLRPAGITLLFTDAYMNNSSSLFGHTLLRVDTARKGTQLLAHGVNYGAWTQGYENSFLYAVYGLAGFYPGGYTVKPYYDIINTYNNIENRDIWEYNLNLSNEELDFFVAHIWEVGQTTTPYYFFTQNCSYMLMEVFDAVKPEFKLAQSFPMQTIPLDTIKEVNKREGLVKSINYRPSRQRKIKYRMKQMSDEQYQAFLDAIQLNLQSTKSLPEEQQADVFETAYQYIQYQYVAKDIDLSEYRKKSFALLKARNQVKAGQKFNELQEGENPVYSHDSKQISLGLGTYNGKFFEELRLRPAYHSLIDRSFGFLPGAAINFLDMSFRHYDDKNNYVLQRLNILQLTSLSPIDEVFAAPSYQITVDVLRQLNPSDEDSYYTFSAAVEGGGTYALSDNVWLYALTGVNGAYGGALPRNQWVGLSLKPGVLIRSKVASLQLEAQKVWATSKIGSTLKWNVTADYFLTRNWALEAAFSYTQNYGKNVTETVLRLKRNF